ncbi:hypothetical protein I7I53_07223 [Histoplasma capsulatum var. duboisii H88]|uniref:Uncharacterized protein n=1 Tax=Ajellomyces capsulatus (strain H88) TaxID=544711 RepID=A0A8A1LJ23_AJEC8|nr:hypothetical protein I7I53_07223 [Histoplasma capsulatum var. duboisii H88]
MPAASRRKGGGKSKGVKWVFWAKTASPPSFAVLLNLASPTYWCSGDRQATKWKWIRKNRNQESGAKRSSSSAHANRRSGIGIGANLVHVASKTRW